MLCQSSLLSTVIFLRNPSKDSQRFVDAVVIISAPDWPVRLSNFDNVFDTPFEFGLRMSNNARLCYKLSIQRQMVVTHTFFKFHALPVFFIEYCHKLCIQRQMVVR